MTLPALMLKLDFTLDKCRNNTLIFKILSPAVLLICMPCLQNPGCLFFQKTLLYLNL